MSEACHGTWIKEALGLGCTVNREGQEGHASVVQVHKEHGTSTYRKGHLFL